MVFNVILLIISAFVKTEIHLEYKNMLLKIHLLDDLHCLSSMRAAFYHFKEGKCLNKVMFTCFTYNESRFMLT